MDRMRIAHGCAGAIGIYLAGQGCAEWCHSARLVATHRRQPDVSQLLISFETSQNPEYHADGKSLYGTAGGYIRYIRMILNKGHSDGVEFLIAGR